MTIHKFAAIYGKGQTAKIGHFGDSGYKRSKNIGDKGSDHRAKSGTDNDTDRQVNNIATEQKLFEFSEHKF